MTRHGNIIEDMSGTENYSEGEHCEYHCALGKLKVQCHLSMAMEKGCGWTLATGL